MSSETTVKLFPATREDAIAFELFKAQDLTKMEPSDALKIYKEILQAVKRAKRVVGESIDIDVIR